MKRYPHVNKVVTLLLMGITDPEKNPHGKHMVSSAGMCEGNKLGACRPLMGPWHAAVLMLSKMALCLPCPKPWTGRDRPLPQAKGSLAYQ